MAKHGVLFEKDPFITECMNRGGVANVDLDGGAIIVEGSASTTDFNIKTIAVPTGTTVKRVGIVMNPSVKYDVIGGNKFPAKSKDDRNYYNVAGDPVDYFFPETDVEFGITMANVEGTVAPTTGKFLEVTANSGKYSIKASQTANVPSFEVIGVEDQIYPTGDFTDDIEKVFVLKTRFNG